jgi:PTS system mannose-specific IIB component/fructoselysine and glucoselysine-specific PTS system IIB component
MPILLFRVDDRLIHGQVVVGWGARSGLDYIAVIDDELAASDWEQDLYRAGLPDSIQARFADVENATERIPEWSQQSERGFVLTKDIRTMRRLAERGALIPPQVNLGGIHGGPGRRRVLPYLFLSDSDLEELDRLRQADVHVTAQDVPSARKLEIEELRQLRSS